LAPKLMMHANTYVLAWLLALLATNNCQMKS